MIRAERDFLLVVRLLSGFRLSLAAAAGRIFFCIGCGWSLSLDGETARFLELRLMSIGWSE